ncbi:hypothetical protein [Kitasatospora sp. NPDC001132]
MLGMPAASAATCPSALVVLVVSRRSVPSAVASAMPSPRAGMNLLPSRRSRRTAPGPLPARSGLRPAAEASSARGSTGRGRNSSPAARTESAKVPCVATAT